MVISLFKLVRNSTRRRMRPRTIPIPLRRLIPLSLHPTPTLDIYHNLIQDLTATRLRILERMDTVLRCTRKAKVNHPSRRGLYRSRTINRNSGASRSIRAIRSHTAKWRRLPLQHNTDIHIRTPMATPTTMYVIFSEVPS